MNQKKLSICSILFVLLIDSLLIVPVKKKCELNDVEVHKVVNKPMNVSLHLINGCETRARSRFDNFTVQRLEYYASNTQS